MMELTRPTNLVGKLVKDEWGRQIGMVVSVLPNGNGEMSWLLVRMGDGRIRRFRLSDVVTVDSAVVIRSSLRRRVESLRRRMALINRQGALLFTLKEGMNGDAAEEMGKELDKSLSMIKAEAMYLLKKVEEACKRCANQIMDIQKGMACLEIERDMGNVPDEVYDLSMKIMMADLKKLTAEREDLMKLRSELFKMLESSKPPKKTPEPRREPLEEQIEEPISVEVEESSEADATGS
ncbi:MAG TPA: hypothetical protein ENF34_04210 [Candidatus Bathyarchaeota archaeon]|nr:hypothetical protein [Candidatus Bathyarchaeota archaeon]